MKPDLCFDLFLATISNESDVSMDIDIDEEKKLDTQTTSEPLRPVDIDLNLVKSFLESLASQEGMAGPVANLLAEFKDAKQQAKK
jgi:hypothetical protein